MKRIQPIFVMLFYVEFEVGLYGDTSCMAHVSCNICRRVNTSKSHD